MNENSIRPQDLIHKNEKKFFVLVLIISLLSYIGLAFSIIGIIVLLVLLLISFLLSALMIGNIRANAVKLSEAQFPEVYKKTKELCERMEIASVPDIYVMQSGGVLNAFATRFFRRDMVVIYSEIFELIETKEEDVLHFVLAHELAHIKRRHLTKLALLLPAMWIPGIAELYLRSCEYTCDRYSSYYVGNREAAKDGLTILAIGKQLYHKVNKEEYMKQLNSEHGFFVWLSEVLSTHPPLPKRINEINMLFGETNTGLILPRKVTAGWVIGFISMLVTIGVLAIGAYFYVNEILLYDPWEEVEDEPYVEEFSPLITAIANGEIVQVEELVAAGEDVHQEDYYGNTALDWAVKTGNVEMVNVLLDSGADPNFESSYGLTGLMTAAEIGDKDIIQLLIDRGGDPNYQEYSGMTALAHAIYSSDVETVQVLLDLGADPTITDYENMTPYMFAIQSDEREIAGLLKKYNK